MTGTWWSRAETDELERLAGDFPWSKVLEHFTVAARENGWLQRTDSAIRVKAEQMGSRIACGQWIRLGVVRQILGVAPTVTNRWTSQGLLPIHIEGPGHGSRARFYVHRDSLRKFAKKHPAYFAGLPKQDLAILFDPGSPTVERFAAMPRQRLVGQPRPVRCVETGETFPSAAAASRQVFVTPSAVRAAIYKNTPAAGRHWQYLDQEAA